MYEVHFRAWREWARLSQKQLAEIMHSSKPVISRIESGTRRWHSEFLQDFHAAVGCPHWSDPLVRKPDAGMLQPEPSKELMEHRKAAIALVKERREKLSEQAAKTNNHKPGPRRNGG